MQKILKEYKRNYPRGRTDLIKKAYHFAKKAHEGQKRYSGESYFLHPKATAEHLALWGLGEVTIAAGLLHDVSDDTPVTQEELRQEFGPEVARLVRGVSRAGNVKLRGNVKLKQVENLRQLFLVMARDLRVVFVKLADRLHNMQTLAAVPLSKQARIAKETLEVYAPLAERVGMGEVKGELEDLAFPYLFGKEYLQTKKTYQKHAPKVGDYLRSVRQTLEKYLAEAGIKAQMHGRSKHLYSLYKKLELRGGDIFQVYDLVALRVVVKNISDCYKALGVVHKVYRPAFSVAPIKDYIANPKTNGYQSLHTNVLGKDGLIFEVQIRTQKMHEEAEYGLAAHWHYSEAKKSGQVSDESLTKGVLAKDTQLEWVKRLASWQKEEQDPDEYLKALKTDVFEQRIFVLTPKSDVVDLPKGATPVDFAYSIHSEVAECCCGVKINGKIAPLSTKLKNGDIVEIITGKRTKKPSRDWLSFVVTTDAKSRIRKALRS
jgi:guanosine-3',5'-bis(diphosphate) 3'-pyrophosphohydrolase